MSNRLTGGPTVNCLTGEEQAGEGWSDFFALTMTLDPELDDPEGPRGMAPYALFGDDRSDTGIRPAPYSRNMEIQPFTYDSIKSGGWRDGGTLSVPHGVGHGWAAVLWDMTWDLIDKHGFNPDVYGDWDSGGNNRALQYVTDGLKFQGCDPGFVTSRDAIIAAADHVSDGADTCTLWASFARRGLGYSAVQGTSADRGDNSEAFDTHPDCRNGFDGGVSDQPELNDVHAGATQPLSFSLGGDQSGDQSLDIMASNSPHSRQVSCDTLRTENPLPVGRQAVDGALLDQLVFELGDRGAAVIPVRAAVRCWFCRSRSTYGAPSSTNRKQGTKVTQVTRSEARTAATTGRGRRGRGRRRRTRRTARP